MAVLLLYCVKCRGELRERHEVDAGVCDDCESAAHRGQTTKFRTKPRRHNNNKQRKYRVV